MRNSKLGFMAGVAFLSISILSVSSMATEEKMGKEVGEYKPRSKGQTQKEKNVEFMNMLKEYDTEIQDILSESEKSTSNMGNDLISIINIGEGMKRKGMEMLRRQKTGIQECSLLVKKLQTKIDFTLSLLKGESEEQQRGMDESFKVMDIFYKDIKNGTIVVSEELENQVQQALERKELLIKISKDNVITVRNIFDKMQDETKGFCKITGIGNQNNDE